MQTWIFLLTYFNIASMRGAQSIWSQDYKYFTTNYGYKDFEINLMNAGFLFFYAVLGVFSGNLADKFNKGTFLFFAHLCIAINISLLGSL